MTQVDTYKRFPPITVEAVPESRQAFQLEHGPQYQESVPVLVALALGVPTVLSVKDPGVTITSSVRISCCPFYGFLVHPHLKYLYHTSGSYLDGAPSTSLLFRS